MKTMNHKFNRSQNKSMAQLRAPFLATCTAIVLLSANLASAGVLLTEDFLSSDGYTDGVALKDQTLTGPSGLTGSWTAGTSLLKYEDSANLGNAGGGAIINQTAGNNRGSTRALSPTLQFDNDTSAYYLSFNMSFSTVDATGGAFTGIRHADGTGFAFGLAAGVKDGNFVLFNRNSATSAHEVVDLGVAYTAGTHSFFIKLDNGGTADWNGTENMTIWINPSDTSSELAATLSSTVTTTFTSTSGAGSNPLNTLTLSTDDEYTAASTIGFDQIILATDWDSVVAIPEPSTALLMMMVGGAMLLLGKKRKS